MTADIVFESLGELGGGTSGVDGDIMRITANTEKEDVIAIVDGRAFHVNVIVTNSFITSWNVEVFGYRAESGFHTWAGKGGTKVLCGASKSLFDGTFILVQKAFLEFVVTFVTKGARIALLTINIDVIVGDVVLRWLATVR